MRYCTSGGHTHHNDICLIQQRATVSGLLQTNLERFVNVIIGFIQYTIELDGWSMQRSEVFYLSESFVSSSVVSPSAARSSKSSGSLALDRDTVIVPKTLTKWELFRGRLCTRSAPLRSNSWGDGWLPILNLFDMSASDYDRWCGEC